MQSGQSCSWGFAVHNEDQKAFLLYLSSMPQAWFICHDKNNTIYIYIIIHTLYVIVVNYNFQCIKYNTLMLSMNGSGDGLRVQSGCVTSDWPKAHARTAWTFAW